MHEPISSFLYCIKMFMERGARTYRAGTVCPPQRQILLPVYLPPSCRELAIQLQQDVLKPLDEGALTRILSVLNNSTSVQRISIQCSIQLK